MTQTVEMASRDARQQENRPNSGDFSEASLTTTLTAAAQELAQFATLITLPSPANFITQEDRLQLGLAATGTSTSGTSTSAGPSQYLATGFFSPDGALKRQAPAPQQQAKVLAPQGITVQQSPDMSDLRVIAMEYLEAQAAQEKTTVKMTAAQLKLAEMTANNSVGMWNASLGNEPSNSPTESQVYGY